MQLCGNTNTIGMATGLEERLDFGIKLKWNSHEGKNLILSRVSTPRLILNRISTWSESRAGPGGLLRYVSFYLSLPAINNKIILHLFAVLPLVRDQTLQVKWLGCTIMWNTHGGRIHKSIGLRITADGIAMLQKKTIGYTGYSYKITDLVFLDGSAGEM